MELNPEIYSVDLCVIVFLNPIFTINLRGKSKQIRAKSNAILNLVNA